jgi:hypothetical protein
MTDPDLPARVSPSRAGRIAHRANRTLAQILPLTEVIEALLLVAAGEKTDSDKEPPSKELQLLQRMADPTFSTDSYGKPIPLETHLKAVGYRPLDLIDLIRKREYAVAMLDSATGVGSVLAELRRLAEPQSVTCDHCGGEGTVVDHEADPIGQPDEGEEPIYPVTKCLAVDGGCDGSGRKLQDGKLDAIKLLLSVHGLIKGGGSAGGGQPINIDIRQQQSNLNQGRDRSGPESVTVEVQKILEGGN